jgi:SOS-response transcriptional repressor LexA
MESKDAIMIGAAAIGQVAVTDPNLSDAAYGLSVKDSAMTTGGGKSLDPTDLVIVDPFAELSPGQIALAHVQGDDEPMIRRYGEQLDDVTGDEIVVLSAANPDFRPRRVSEDKITFKHRVLKVQKDL